MATRRPPNRSIPSRQGQPHPIKARKHSGRYNKDRLRDYYMLYDPQGLFGGGWFFRADLKSANNHSMDWLIPDMVFEQRKTGTLIVVERDRTLAEVTGEEAAEIRALLRDL